MNEVTRHFCLHQNFVPRGQSTPAPGLYTKKCIKSGFKEICFKFATNDRSGKMFLLTSKFHPQGLSAPAPGLYIKSWGRKYKIRFQRDFF